MPDFISNSAYGEDAMLFGLIDRLNLINNINLFKYNTYIDVGCFHPVIDNNTYFLYKLGWRGTLVDPNPAIKKEKDTYRKDDLFLQFAISNKKEYRNFMIFNDHNSTNTLDPIFLDRLKKSSNQEIEKVLRVECITLDDLLDVHIKTFNTEPFLINIDIEGMDYDVISSYSFKHRPLFIMIEDEVLGSFEGSKLKSFMESKNYYLVSSNFLTGIYMDAEDDLFSKMKKIGMYDTIDSIKGEGI